MKIAFYASLAVIPWVAVTLLLRWLISIEGWPVGLVGTLSRCITLPVLAGWIVMRGASWQRLRPQGQTGWLLLMGAISILINLTWFSAVRWTTATNVGMLIRFDVVFVVLIGSLLGLGLVGGDFARTADVLASKTALASIVMLGVLVAASLPLYYVALRRMDVWKLRIFMLATPVLTAVIEWPLWGIELSPLQWLGGAIIFAGLAVLIQMEWRMASTEDDAQVAATSAGASRAVGDEAGRKSCVSSHGQHPTKDKIA